MKDHVVNINDDSQLKCLNCGAVSQDFTADLPVQVAVVFKGIRDFENAHKNCAATATESPEHECDRCCDPCDCISNSAEDCDWCGVCQTQRQMTRSEAMGAKWHSTQQ